TCGLRKVIVWDVATGKRLHTFLFRGNEGNSTPLASMAFSPTSRFFAVSRNTNIVKVWDLRTGNEVFEHRAASSMYMATRFGDRDDRLETALWEFSTGHFFESWNIVS